MKMTFRRAVAASLPIAVLLTSTLALDAAPVVRSSPVRTFVRHAPAAMLALGGGATLPIPAYIGVSEASGQVMLGQAGSLFGFLAGQSDGLNIAYCATGSGKGKEVFTGPPGTVDTPCSNATNPNPPYGFAPNGYNLKLVHPAVTGSDSPLLQSDYSTFEMDNETTQLEPTQLPSIIGSIAIYYNNSGITQRANFTDADICGIYDGTITNFNQLSTPLNNQPITPVYRSDGSGTSFNFSNHLASAGGCAGDGFGGNQTFATADPNLPGNAIGASGNAGVVSTVQNTPGAVGYAEAGYVTNPQFPDNYGTVTNATTGTQEDPILNLPEAAASIKANAQSVLADQAIVFNPSAPATTTPLTGVPKPDCVGLVAPAAYARPPAGYPIVAVTYLLFSYEGNSPDAGGLQQLIFDLNTPSDFGPTGIATINRATASTGTGTTGYSALGGSFNGVLKVAAQRCINK